MIDEVVSSSCPLILDEIGTSLSTKFAILENPNPLLVYFRFSYRYIYKS